MVCPCVIVRKVRGYLLLLLLLLRCAEIRLPANNHGTWSDPGLVHPAPLADPPGSPRPSLMPQVGFFHLFADNVDYVFIDHGCYRSKGKDIYSGNREDLLFR